MTAAIRYSEDPEFYHLLVSGDEEAMRVLLDELGPVMMRLIAAGVRGIGNKADIQDLFQVAALRIWRWRDRFDSQRGSLRSWVTAITRSVTAEFARRERRRRRLLQLITTRADWLETTDPSIDLDSMADQKALLHALVLRLSQRDREIAQLYLAGRTYPQIAEVLGVNIGAARTRMTRLRQSLRSFLADGVL